MPKKLSKKAERNQATLALFNAVDACLNAGMNHAQISIAILDYVEGIELDSRPIGLTADTQTPA